MISHQLSKPFFGCKGFARNSGIAIALGALLCSSVSNAESVTSTDEVVVTATRIPTPRSKVGSSVTVITAADIERKQLRTLVQALRMVPGLDVVQSGGIGQQTSVFMRGASSSHTLVLIDGINVADPSSPSGAVDFANLLVDNVERIEVVRGPQSTLYGSNAIGGVINIITKKGQGAGKASLVMEAGNNSSNYQQLGVSGAANDLNYSLTGTHLKTNGDSVTPERLRNGLNAENDPYRNYSLSGRTGYTLNKNLEFNVYGRYIDGKADTDPETGQFGTVEDPDARLKTREYFLRGESIATLMDGFWDATVSAAYTDYNRRNNNNQNVPFGTIQKTKFTGDTTEVSLNNDLYLNESNTLTLGGGSKKEQMKNSGFSDFGGFVISEASDADARTNYAYVQDQFSFSDQLFGTAGVRVDDHDSFSEEVTYRLTGVYQLLDLGTRFTGSVGTGFRAPSLFELFGFSPDNFGTAYRGNENLDPETSFSWELGFEQPLFSNQYRIGATYFKNDIDDLIETVFDPSFNSTSENINNVELTGVEAFIAADVIPGLSARADYTYTDAEVSDDSDRPLLRRPKNKASLDLDYQAFGKANLFIGIDYIGNRKDVDRATGQIFSAKSYTVVDTAMSWQLDKTFKLQARVNNLMDKDYEPADGFQALGRNYMVGFTAGI